MVMFAMLANVCAVVTCAFAVCMCSHRYSNMQTEQCMTGTSTMHTKSIRLWCRRPRNLCKLFPAAPGAVRSWDICMRAEPLHCRATGTIWVKRVVASGTHRFVFQRTCRCACLSCLYQGSCVCASVMMLLPACPLHDGGAGLGGSQTQQDIGTSDA
jgi:hypothetical protein